MDTFSAGVLLWMFFHSWRLWNLPVQQEFNWVATGKAKPAAGKLYVCLENQVPFFIPASSLWDFYILIWFCIQCIIANKIKNAVYNVIPK